jgi:hypothetical protein
MTTITTISLTGLPYQADGLQTIYVPGAEDTRLTVVTGVLTPFNQLEQVLALTEPYVVWGLWVPEPALTLPAQMRTLYGQAIFDRAMRIFVEDELSREWLAHFGVDSGRVQIAPSCAWLAPPDGDPRTLDAGVPDIAIRRAIRGDTGAIFCDVPALGEVKFGGVNPNHVMLRWAAKYGANNAVVTTAADEFETQARRREHLGVPETVIERARNTARAVLSELVSRPSAPRQKLAELLGPDGGDDLRPRTLELGSVFDPATHYTAHYYDGRGLLYARADGTWQTYHGPAGSWGGFDRVVGILAKLDLGGPLLDIGCSSGDFVERALDHGIEAWGVDLSKDAIDMARPSTRERLLCADITKIAMQRQFRTTTAWDFWEHIWPQDLDALADAIYDMTEPGGHHAAIICTRGDGELDFVAEPGITFTEQNSVILCSGHVHIRDWAWWATYFTKRGWLLASQRALAFNVAIASDPQLRQCQSWSPRNLMLLKKPARRR